MNFGRACDWGGHRNDCFDSLFNTVFLILQGTFNVQLKANHDRVRDPRLQFVTWRTLSEVNCEKGE